MHSRSRRYLSVFVFSALLWLILWKIVRAPVLGKLDNDFVYYNHQGLPAPLPSAEKRLLAKGLSLKNRALSSPNSGRKNGNLPYDFG